MSCEENHQLRGHELSGNDPLQPREEPIQVSEPCDGVMSRFQEALTHAARLHAGQTRKGGEEIRYIGHLLGVCSLTLEAGGDEDQAIAALLHDAAEDQGGRETLESIRCRFGDRVAGIVEACTDTFEDPKPPWRRRKERYLEHIDSLPADTLLIVCADKLYNARAILQDCRRLGDRVFERFRSDKEATLWYYRSVAEALARSELESWLVEELARTVSELEAATSVGPLDRAALDHGVS